MDTSSLQNVLYRARMTHYTKLSPTLANSDQHFAQAMCLRPVAEVRVNDGCEVYRQLPERGSAGGDITLIRTGHRAPGTVHRAPCVSKLASVPRL
jgi:hypothetical protein